MPKKPKRLYWAVIGRIPYDDEDSCYIIRTTSREKAIENFEKQIYQDSDKDPEKVIEEHGQAVFINHILTSKSEIHFRS